MRMNRTRTEGGRGGRGGVPTTLLGGILRCGLCGGAVVKISATSYGCAARRDRGLAVCRGISAPQRRVDDVLVGHVREHLKAPQLVSQLEREAGILLTDRGRQGDSRRELGQRVTALEAEARRLTDALAAVGTSPTVVERLRTTEAEIDRLKRAQTRAAVATLPSAARDAVRTVLNDLGRALDADLPVARDALRAALGDVTLQNDEDGVFAVFEDTADRLLLRAVGDGMGLVAGARFELATFGL
jgi:site-specific DNA recombinase